MTANEVRDWSLYPIIRWSRALSRGRPIGKCWGQLAFLGLLEECSDHELPNEASQMDPSYNSIGVPYDQSAAPASRWRP